MPIGRAPYGTRRPKTVNPVSAFSIVAKITDTSAARPKLIRPIRIIRWGGVKRSLSRPRSACQATSQ